MPEGLTTIEQIDRAVARIFESKRFRPPLLPEVALRLSRLADDPSSTLAMAEDAAASDPNVAARVVAVANSAAVRGAVEITSLQAAVCRLGLNRVRDVAFHVVAAGSLFRVPAYEEHVEQVIEAAHLSAALATAVSRAARRPSPSASLCGLLHDMGEPLVLGVIARYCEVRKNPVPPVEMVAPIVARWHTHFGALACMEWGLPDVVTDSVQFHHAPKWAAHSRSLAPLLRAVDVLLRHVGVGRPCEPVSNADLPAFRAAGLTPDALGPLIQLAEESADRARSAA